MSNPEHSDDQVERPDLDLSEVDRATRPGELSAPLRAGLLSFLDSLLANVPGDSPRDLFETTAPARTCKALVLSEGMPLEKLVPTDEIVPEGDIIDAETCAHISPQGNCGNTVTLMVDGRISIADVNGRPTTCFILQQLLAQYDPTPHPDKQ